MNLSYAYAGNADEYPMLGSVVRALGKGWHVQVQAPDAQLELYRLLKKRIICPELLELRVSEHYSLVLNREHQMILDPDPMLESYDLISRFETHQLHPSGVTAVTGTGKGKTTSAIGMALEAYLHGNKPVAVIQWFKELRTGGELSWAINEHAFPALLRDPERFIFHPTGLGFFGSPKFDHVTGDAAYAQHRKKAADGLLLAKKLIQSGKYQLVVLDELIDTVKEIAGNIPYPLLTLEELRAFFEDVTTNSRSRLVVTGRRVTPEWERWIGTSTVIHEVKHPWKTRHAGAVSGLDF